MIEAPPIHNSSPFGEEFVVRFTRKGLGKLQRAIAVMFLFSIVAAGIGIFDNPDTMKMVVLQKFLLVMAPVILIFAIVMLRASLAWRNRPALIATAKDLHIGFAFGQPFSLAWSAVLGVSTKDASVGKTVINQLIIHVKDPSVLIGKIGGFSLKSSKLTGHPPLSVNLEMLDRSWDEIRAAFRHFGGVDGEIPLTPRDFSVVQERVRVLHEQTMRERNHNGTLVTLEDYRRVFRNGPVGCWDTVEAGSSPADTSLCLCNDGSGSYGEGASFMLEHVTALEWRSTGDFLVEMRPVGNDHAWLRFRFEFREWDGNVTIKFSEEDDDPASDPFPNLTVELLPYKGLCRGDSIPSNTEN
ncbi:hypothetical protein EON81_02085 [bacterium]|nr:MAG: hypothetical protein EON81_02085 [bacterium]